MKLRNLQGRTAVARAVGVVAAGGAGAWAAGESGTFSSVAVPVAALDGVRGYTVSADGSGVLEVVPSGIVGFTVTRVEGPVRQVGKGARSRIADRP